jgi:tRNA threonylcarbamoyladenosine biosynthesis protein TsaB
MEKKVILHIDTKDNKKTLIMLEIDGKKSKTSKVTNSWSSQILLPMIWNILEKNKLSISDIAEIIVDKGPGSFTGLRVGIAVANVLGYLLKVPVNGKKGNIVEPIYE